ncbi:hypothetical protein PATSB16_30310 [Pandoraea thiooxydans]|uniref:Anti-CBASS protein Acb1 n=1 Tax=Pandoraea thiooxydans TaxID=445709 RepID=A0A0G3EP63_9BURK|nr:hypothetical protein PATSB16_30310 [Pandoraea thiooxydans]
MPAGQVNASSLSAQQALLAAEQETARRLAAAQAQTKVVQAALQKQYPYGMSDAQWQAYLQKDPQGQKFNQDWLAVQRSAANQLRLAGDGAKDPSGAGAAIDSEAAKLKASGKGDATLKLLVDDAVKSVKGQSAASRATSERAFRMEIVNQTPGATDAQKSTALNDFNQALGHEIALQAAQLHLKNAQADMAALNKEPGGARRADYGDVSSELSRAQSEYAQVQAGHDDAGVDVSPAEQQQAAQAVAQGHSTELYSLGDKSDPLSVPGETAVISAQQMLQHYVANVNPNDPTLTPAQKQLAQSDPVAFAQVQMSGVQIDPSQIKNGWEKQLAQSNPLEYAIYKMTGVDATGVNPDDPSLSATDKTELHNKDYLQYAIAHASQSAQAKIGLLLGSGQTVRFNRVQSQVNQLTQGTRTSANDAKALQILQTNMSQALLPGEADALWTQIGAPKFSASYLQSQFNALMKSPGREPSNDPSVIQAQHDDTMNADKVGKWLQQMTKNAPPQFAALALDTIQKNFNEHWFESNTGTPAMGRGTDFYKGLSQAVQVADAQDPQAHQYADSTAQWLLAASNLKGGETGKAGPMIFIIQGGGDGGMTFQSVRDAMSGGYGTDLADALNRQIGTAKSGPPPGNFTMAYQLGSQEAAGKQNSQYAQQSYQSFLQTAPATLKAYFNDIGQHYGTGSSQFGDTTQLDNFIAAGLNMAPDAVAMPTAPGANGQGTQAQSPLMTAQWLRQAGYAAPQSGGKPISNEAWAQLIVSGQYALPLTSSGQLLSAQELAKALADNQYAGVKPPTDGHGHALSAAQIAKALGAGQYQIPSTGQVNFGAQATLDGRHAVPVDIYGKPLTEGELLHQISIGTYQGENLYAHNPKFADIVGPIAKRLQSVAGVSLPSQASAPGASGAPMLTVSLIPTFYASNDGGASPSGLFGVTDKSSHHTKLIDDRGWHYDNLSDYQHNNALSGGKLYVPTWLQTRNDAQPGGIELASYSKGPAGAMDIAYSQVDSHQTTGWQHVENVLSIGAELVTAAAGTALLFTGVGTALGVTLLGVTAAGVGWGMYTSVEDLHNMAEHGGTINPFADGRARMDWGMLAVSAFGLGASGATLRGARLLMLAKTLPEAEQAGVLADAMKWDTLASRINRPAMVGGTYQMVNQGESLIRNWDQMSGEQKWSQLAMIGMNLTPFFAGKYIKSLRGEIMQQQASNQRVLDAQAQAQTQAVAVTNGQAYWINWLNDAINTGKFKLQYQPLHDSLSGEIAHYEVLIRHSDLRPDQFVPALEAHGLSLPLAQWVIAEAVRAAAGHPDANLAINLSGPVLNDSSLPTFVDAVLSDYSVSAARISFEITETGDLPDMQVARDVLRRLRARGHEIAIDDFDQQRSLDYVSRLLARAAGTHLFDMLKIDRAWVSALGDPAVSEAVKFVVDDMHRMGIKVIGEGVETEQDRARLEALGVDIQQGWYWGRPGDLPDHTGLPDKMPSRPGKAAGDGSGDEGQGDGNASSGRALSADYHPAPPAPLTAAQTWQLGLTQAGSPSVTTMEPYISQVTHQAMRGIDPSTLYPELLRIGLSENTARAFVAQLREDPSHAVVASDQMDVQPEYLDMSRAVPVISTAQKFILPIPPLADGEPLVYPAGAIDANGTSLEGQPILDWQGNSLGETGVVFYNAKDQSLQAVPGDGSGVIIFNEVTEAQAAALSAAVTDLAGTPAALNHAQVMAVLDVAASLGLTDCYNSDVGFIRSNMTPMGDLGADCFGLYKRDDRDTCWAVRLVGRGTFKGPAASPQRFGSGAVIVRQGNEYRLVQPAEFGRTYCHSDATPIDVMALPVGLRAFNVEGLLDTASPGQIEDAGGAQAGSFAGAPTPASLGLTYTKSRSGNWLFLSSSNDPGVSVKVQIGAVDHSSAEGAPVINVQELKTGQASPGSEGWLLMALLDHYGVLPSSGTLLVFPDIVETSLLAAYGNGGDPARTPLGVSLTGALTAYGFRISGFHFDDHGEQLSLVVSILGQDEARTPPPGNGESPTDDGPGGSLSAAYHRAPPVISDAMRWQQGLTDAASPMQSGALAGYPAPGVRQAVSGLDLVTLGNHLVTAGVSHDTATAFTAALQEGATGTSPYMNLPRVSVAGVVEPPGAADVAPTLALLDAAERADTKLSARDVSTLLGYEPLLPWRRVMDGVKRWLPILKSRAQKMAKAMTELHQHALWENQARDEQAALHDWLGGLSPTQLASLQIKPHAIGGPAWMQRWTLVAQGASDGEACVSFDAGYLPSLPDSMRSRLPVQVRAPLDAQAQFLAQLGIENGPQAAEFFNQHFDVIELDPQKKLPAEIAKLINGDPALQAAYAQAQADGGTLSLIKCKQTPEAVLDAIRQIAEQSQHKFVSTWLRGLVISDTDPKILQADFDRMVKSYNEQMDAVQHKVDENSFRGQVLGAQKTVALLGDMDFAGAIDLIRSFSTQTLHVTAADGGAAGTPDLTLLNAALEQNFGRQHAYRRFVTDDANRASEGARAIINALVGMTFLVKGVEQLLHLNSIARSIAAIGDDAAAESAEISALRGAGMTDKELRDRLWKIAPAGVVAAIISNTIDLAVKHFGNRVGGALYSASAVLLSAVTGLMSVKYFADHYRQLESEGKVPGYIALDATMRRNLDALGQVDLPKEQMIAAVDDALARADAEPGVREAVGDYLRELDSADLVGSLLSHSRPSSWGGRWLAGLKEATGINPARLGLTLGTYSSPLMGFAFGPYFLHNPWLYAAAGSFETIVGAVSIWAYNLSFDLRWSHAVDHTEVTLPDAPGATPPEEPQSLSAAYYPDAQQPQNDPGEQSPAVWLANSRVGALDQFPSPAARRAASQLNPDLLQAQLLDIGLTPGTAQEFVAQLSGSANQHVIAQYWFAGGRDNAGTPFDEMEHERFGLTYGYGRGLLGLFSQSDPGVKLSVGIDVDAEGNLLEAAANNIDIFMIDPGDLPPGADSRMLITLLQHFDIELAPTGRATIWALDSLPTRDALGHQIDPSQTPLAKSLTLALSAWGLTADFEVVPAEKNSLSLVAHWHQAATTDAPLATETVNEVPQQGLYVSRPVDPASAQHILGLGQSALSGDINWVPPDKMHVTVVRSPNDLRDGEIFTPQTDPLTILPPDDANATWQLIKLGNGVVLRFEAPALKARWEETRQQGAGWTYGDTYVAHVTVAYEIGQGSESIPVAPFPITLGGERVEPFDAQWVQRQGLGAKDNSPQTEAAQVWDPRADGVDTINLAFTHSYIPGQSELHVESPPNTFAVRAHGTPDSTLLDEQGKAVGPYQFVLQHNLFWKFGQTIFLAVDHAGAGGDRAYVQQLADTLNTEVIAPDGPLRISQDQVEPVDGVRWLRFSPRPTTPDFSVEIGEQGELIAVDAAGNREVRPLEALIGRLLGGGVVKTVFELGNNKVVALADADMGEVMIDLERQSTELYRNAGAPVSKMYDQQGEGFGRLAVFYERYVCSTKDIQREGADGRAVIESPYFNENTIEDAEQLRRIILAVNDGELPGDIEVMLAKDGHLALHDIDLPGLFMREGDDQQLARFNEFFDAIIASARRNIADRQTDPVDSLPAGASGGVAPQRLEIDWAAQPLAHPNQSYMPDGAPSVRMPTLGDIASHCKVFASGGEDGVVLDHQGDPVSPHQLALDIELDWEKDQPVLLAADNAGLGGSHAYAQRLADVLGTDVIAPDFELRMGKGHRVVMDGEGDWYRFRPRPEVPADYTLDVQENGRVMLTDAAGAQRLVDPEIVLGRRLGSGGAKLVFAFGKDKAIGVLAPDLERELLDSEKAELDARQAQGYPVIGMQVPQDGTILGRPFAIYERYQTSVSAEGLLSRQGGQDIVADSPYFNQRTLADAVHIRGLVERGPTVVNDFELGLFPDGRLVLTDPYDPDSEAVWPRQRQLAVLDQIIAHAQRHVDEV